MSVGFLCGTGLIFGDFDEMVKYQLERGIFFPIKSPRKKVFSNFIDNILLLLVYIILIYWKAFIIIETFY